MNTPQLALGATETTDYGTNTIGKPYRPPGGGWERIDTYHSTIDADHRERRFAASADDFSPMARAMYAGKGNCQYHPKCECCWLGFSHTLALHNRRAFNDDGTPKAWD